MVNQIVVNLPIMSSEEELIMLVVASLAFWSSINALNGIECPRYIRDFATFFPMSIIWMLLNFG